MEGFLRCAGAGSSASAGFAGVDTATKPTATIVGAAFVTACHDGNAQATRPPSPVFGRGLGRKNREGRT
jgi:hypothetical protein